MKARHAAALALVGWYLVYPINPPAPYSGDICCGHNEETLPEHWCSETDVDCLKFLKELGITNTNPLSNKNEWKVMRRGSARRNSKRMGYPLSASRATIRVSRKSDRLSYLKASPAKLANMEFAFLRVV
jgi:hypothetical protein